MSSFKEHPLETLLRETLQREGRTKTMSVDGRRRSVKYIEVNRLRDIARRQGYLPDEVDEALELLTLRQYIERQPDGTVQEFAGTLDADELKHQARQLEEHLSELASYFRDELRTHTSLLEEVRANLADPEDEVAIDTAHRKLQELEVRLDEFIRGKGRELANQLMSLSDQMERRSSELQPRELEQQVTGAVDFVRHVDDQRRVLGQRFRQLSQKWQHLQQKINQLHQQAREAAGATALCSLTTKRAALENEKRQLDTELQSPATVSDGIATMARSCCKGNRAP
jgi:hypothetical protein